MGTKNRKSVLNKPLKLNVWPGGGLLLILTAYSIVLSVFLLKVTPASEALEPPGARAPGDPHDLSSPGSEAPSSILSAVQRKAFGPFTRSRRRRFRTPQSAAPSTQTPFGRRGSLPEAVSRPQAEIFGFRASGREPKICPEAKNPLHFLKPWSKNLLRAPWPPPTASRESRKLSSESRRGLPSESRRDGHWALGIDTSRSDLEFMTLEQ